MPLGPQLLYFFKCRITVLTSSVFRGSNPVLDSKAESESLTYFGSGCVRLNICYCSMLVSTVCGSVFRTFSSEIRYS